MLLDFTILCVRHASLLRLTNSTCHGLCCRRFWTTLAGVPSCVSASPDAELDECAHAMPVRENRSCDTNIWRTANRCRCGTAFTVAVISEHFEGKKLLQRHKMVSSRAWKMICSRQDSSLYLLRLRHPLYFQSCRQNMQTTYIAVIVRR